MFTIGIDPSLSSTAMTVHINGEYSFYNYTNNSPDYKWIQKVDKFVHFQFHEYTSVDDFTESEIDKIEAYDVVTDRIVDDISTIVKRTKSKSHVFIEGYSYSAQAGRLIDLVTFSTLLRYKLHKKGVVLHIIPPSTLKMETAKLVYQSDKKGIYRDENGKAGGSFDKKDMMRALLHFDIDEEYFQYIKDNSDVLLKPKNIPKPFDDINDSLLLVLIGKKRMSL